MMADLQTSASVAVNQCLGVRGGENCLVVTDAPCRAIGMALFHAAQVAGAEVVLMDMLPRGMDGEEPPASVGAAMLVCDVLVAATFRSLSHTAARRSASDKGARVATMPGITEETMVRTMGADYARVAELSDGIAAILTEGREARLTTEAGTDIRFGIAGRDGLSDTGILVNAGDFGNLPAGEAFIGPLEGTSQGTVVVDGAMGDSGVLDGERIVLTVKNGHAVEIAGGRAARELEAAIEQYGGDARSIAELGVGTNEKARVVGNILEDEKVLGTVHVAIGNNMSMGGVVDVPVHLDGIILAPTLEIDGRKILEAGKLLL